jgi:hypothetical protein
MSRAVSDRPTVSYATQQVAAEQNNAENSGTPIDDSPRAKNVRISIGSETNLPISA